MANRETRISRRTYLAGTAAATTGLAGCSVLGGSTGELTVAYMPIFPDLQYFVMDEQGYFDDIDRKVVGEEFTDGPSIVKAYGGGEIDIAMFGVVPAMILVDRGLPAKVTAANIKEPMAILAHEELGPLWDEHGSDAFDVWQEERGEPFRFGTFPQGSVPDILLRYWLEQEGIEPGGDVDIIEIGGANAVWQALANDEIDGTSIMEPVPTRVQSESVPYETFRTAARIMPGQPAAVTLMSDAVRDSEVATQFLDAHVRANEYIQDNPEPTAEIVEDGIGLDSDLALSALQGPLSNFVTDPREIENGTAIFSEFAARTGKLDDPLSPDEIFDYSVYEGI
ncbi:ABC transporter substrate-binding protein [Halapricum desulfuricans]|nr:ABC transporter substrate-binding protein [Halapricum desulfuricans]